MKKKIFSFLIMMLSIVSFSQTTIVTPLSTEASPNRGFQNRGALQVDSLFRVPIRSELYSPYSNIDSLGVIQVTDSVLNVHDGISFVPYATEEYVEQNSIQSVTGDNVDNTDPLNPVINTPNFEEVIAEGGNINTSLLNNDGEDGSSPYATKSRQIVNVPYYYPEWWLGVRIPLRVKNGEAQHNYDVSDNVTLSDYTPYFVSPDGLDANDGLTELTPKRTIPDAVTAGANLIYMMPGTYLRNTFYGAAYNPGGDLIIIGLGEVNITNSNNTTLTWTLTSNNTYSASRTQVTNVIDFKYKNKYGYYSSLKQVTSQALCEAEAGTYYTDDTTVWVHLQDERVPDIDVKPQLYIFSYIDMNANKVYMENLNFYDFEVRVDGLNGDSTLEVYLKNVNVPLCKNTRVSVPANEFNAFRFGTYKKVVVQNCEGMDTMLDVFNYHNSTTPRVQDPETLEIDCRAYNAGVKGSGTSNQCSSVHEGLRILRVNGSYFGGNTQVIADVNESQTILVGCELNSDSGQPNNVILSAVNGDVFGCRLFGNKIIKEDGGTEGLTLKNSIIDYSSTIGNVIIE